MKKQLLTLLFGLFFLTQLKATCNFTVSSTTVCGGDIVTVKLADPVSNYHNLIIFKGNFPFGNNASAPNDFELVNASTLGDKTISFFFRGSSTAQTYTILLAEDNFNTNPTFPCNFSKTITVNPTPDPKITGVLTFCNTSGNQAVTITNASSTKPSNTNYIIDWGDGSPTISDPTFATSLSHTYAQGAYQLKVTVSSGLTCPNVTRIYSVTVGGKLPFNNPSSNPLVTCAPSYYELDIPVASYAVNSPSTYYKIYINGELDTTLSQAGLISTYSHYFLEGSCGKSYVGCSPNYYSIKIDAKNECGSNPFTNCFPVKDSVNPKIQGNDTVCTNTTVSYINSDNKSQTFDAGAGTCTKADQTWTIDKPSGYNSVSPAFGTPAKQDLSLVFAQIGNYRISLEVTGDCNTKKVFKDVVVLDKVTASASFPATSCIPPAGFIDVPFTNASTGSILDYTWSINPTTGTSFSGGTNKNTKDPTIQFTQSGNYTVTLQSRGSCNTSTWTGNVNIKGKPSADTSIIPQGCFIPYSFNPSSYFTFNNGGDNSASYSWSFTGGIPASSSSQNPGNISYSSASTYIISATITNICGSATIDNSIIISDNPKPNAGVDFSICKKADSVILSAIPAGGVWSGPGITNTALGVFNPKGLTGGNHSIVYTLNPLGVCPTKDTIVITVIETLGLTAGAPQSICKSTHPKQLQLIGNPSYPGGNWFGTGVVNSVTGVFDPYGMTLGAHQVGYVYTTLVGGCSDTAYKNITIFDSIHLSQPPIVCVGQSFDFGSIVSNVSSGYWNFGDGTANSIIPNPTHTYALPSTYPATLYGTTSDGCKDTIFVSVKAIKSPALSFIMSVDSSCSGQNILFSFPPAHDTALSYFWDFGVQTINENFPNTHFVTFPKPIFNDTLYVIKLTANYPCGSTSYSDTIKIKSSPKANFGVQNIGCSPFTPIFLNSSYGSPTNYTWNFGNGQTSTLPNPIAPVYLNPTRNDSVFTIRLTVLNTCGIDSIKKDIVVKGNNVTASFFTDIDKGCQSLDVNFFSVSSAGVQVVWNFGDGSAAYTEQTQHTFDSAGIFPVKLLAIGACGRDSAIHNITVYAKPKPNFLVTNPCAGSSTLFQNTTTNGGSSIWDFGDASPTSTQISPQHIYDSVGSYTIKLISFNSNNCRDSILKPIAVYTQPKAAFTVLNPSTCETEPTIFINTSTNATGYSWNLGGGNSSTDAAPSFVYPHFGTYDVTLKVNNGVCVDSITKLAAVQIFPAPIADFIYTITPNKFQDPVVFTNTTFSGSIYTWAFGDGDTSSEKDPTHQYNGEGPFRVTLYVVSDKGCKDTVRKALGVDYSGTLYVPNVFAPEVGLGESSIFKPKGLSIKEYHLQIFSTYGQLLWETTAIEDGKPTEGWDGKYNGTLLPQDTYVWKIRAIFTDGKSWEGMKDAKTGKKATMGSLILLR